MSTNLPETNPTTPLLSNTVYDRLNQLALVVLPAIGAFYFGLSTIWGLPYGEQVVGTCTVAALFVGSLVKISNKSYNKSDAKYDGALVIDASDPTKDVYTFEVGTDLSVLKDKQDLVIKVQKSE